MWANKITLNLCLLLCCCNLECSCVSAIASEIPLLTKWYKDSDGAISLRFDDNHQSHLDIVIPLLNKYNINATFMVSPGRLGYRRNKDFWENKVPKMGHRLGNHTMNHSGVKNVKEANYEIGEATKIIRQANSSQSDLMVFASGGGKKWGGKNWEEAENAYHEIVKQYSLIDLYDGKHPSVRIDSTSQIGVLCELLDKVEITKSYQPFHFHNIGKQTFLEKTKAVVRGYDLTTTEETFTEFLKCIDSRKNRIWTAPIVDILKYEEELKGASLKILRSDNKCLTVKLEVKTDPILYDQNLTLKIPHREQMKIGTVVQGVKEKNIYQRMRNDLLVDIEAVNSVITINYEQSK